MGDVGEEREVHVSGALVWLSERSVPFVTSGQVVFWVADVWSSAVSV